MQGISVLTLARKQFRSWMFIYAGLVAAILLSGQPDGVEVGAELEGRMLPAVVNAPLLRRDI